MRDDLKCAYNLMSETWNKKQVGKRITKIDLNFDKKKERSKCSKK